MIQLVEVMIQYLEVYKFLYYFIGKYYTVKKPANVMIAKKRLQSFDNRTLIDIAQNYRQYGYSKSVKQEAIDLLQQRGIKTDEFRLQENRGSNTYDIARSVYRSYCRYSRYSMICYGTFLGSILLGLFLLVGGVTPLFASILTWISVIGLPLYLIFLIKSYIELFAFYRTIGKKWNGSQIMIEVLMGVLFYFFVYYRRERDMQEQLQSL